MSIWEKKCETHPPASIVEEPADHVAHDETEREGNQQPGNGHGPRGELFPSKR